MSTATELHDETTLPAHQTSFRAWVAKAPNGPLAHGGSRTEIEEVVWCPDPDGFVAPDAVEDRSLEIEVLAATGRCRWSDICRHTSDRSFNLPVRIMYTYFGQPQSTTAEARSQARSRWGVAELAIALTRES
jgi:hypothetical protein